MADPYEQAFAELGQALVDLDGDGRPDVAIGLQQSPKRGVRGATGEMRSYTPTMGQRISSALGSYYGPRAEQAVDLLGLTMPYEGGRAAAEGVAGGDTAQTLKGAALLALSPVPGLAAGVARSKAVPYFAEPALDRANGLIKLFESGRADFADRSALQAIKPQLDALPTGTMRAPASVAATGGSAVAGGVLAGASAPFDPASYEDWARVALGAMGGAAAERIGAAAASAPAVSRQFMGAVDVPRVETTRAMTDAALATKQGKKFVTQPSPAPVAPGGPGGNPAGAPALPPGGVQGGAPALPPGPQPGPAPGPQSVNRGAYGPPEQVVARPYIEGEVAAGRSVPSLADLEGILSAAGMNRPLPKDMRGKLNNAQGIVDALRAQGIPDADIAVVLKNMMGSGLPKGLPVVAGAVGAGAMAQEDNPLLSLFGGGP